MRGVAIGVALILVGCDAPTDDGLDDSVSLLCAPTLPDPRDRYSDADAPIPQHFATSTAGSVFYTDNTPPSNPITNAGATLGRVLFYDVRLSASDRIACGSCHRQAFGFADTVRFNVGVHGPLGRRTMALANARFNSEGRFFWDERAATLEEQVLEPVQDEMAMPLETLERKLAGTPFYPPLFAAAFGSPDVSGERVALALAEFVRSLVSSRSRFDAVFATGGAPDTSRLTAKEREGARTFVQAGCVNCHRTVAQIADRANNIGLDVTPADSGAGQGRFKPASLRNIAVRPPYMHDGRFATLEEVLEFYDHGVRADPDLDLRLRAADGSPRRLRLTTEQTAAVIAFLETLTDSAFLHDERFADPFGCSASATPLDSTR